jgi:hypothetical protein
MLTELDRLAAAEAYADTHHLLDAVVLSHLRRYGGDGEEYRSEADEWWLKAFLGYDPACGTEFRTWVRTKAALGVLERHRETYRRQNLLHRRHVDLTRHAEARCPEFDMEGFLEGLSEDAQVVVRLVLERPIDIELNLLARGGPEAKNYKGAVREFLKDLGWSFNRVMETFKEIKEYL